MPFIEPTIRLAMQSRSSRTAFTFLMNTPVILLEHCRGCILGYGTSVRRGVSLKSLHRLFSMYLQRPAVLRQLAPARRKLPSTAVE